MRLLLLSGGIESTCLAFAFRPDLCLTVNYGQIIARSEIASSIRICKYLKLNHKTYKLDLRTFGAGHLAGKIQHAKGPSVEWWPYRNQLLITIGAIVGFRYGMQEILIGCVRSDRRHADGTRNFIRRMDKILKTQEGSLRLHAPGLAMSSEQLIEQTRVPVGILGLTFSCHRSTYPCGQCGGCRKNEAAVSYAILSRRGRS